MSLFSDASDDNANDLNGAVFSTPNEQANLTGLMHFSGNITADMSGVCAHTPLMSAVIFPEKCINPVRFACSLGVLKTAPFKSLALSSLASLKRLMPHPSLAKN